jgi:hypothetical protein
MWRGAIAQGSGTYTRYTIEQRAFAAISGHAGQYRGTGMVRGIVRMIVREKPRATIAEVLGEGEA